MSADNLQPESDKFKSSDIKVFTQRKLDLMLKETIALLKKALE